MEQGNKQTDPRGKTNRVKTDEGEEEDDDDTYVKFKE